MSNPKVTVITPTYNRADLLGETVESILRQRFADFEYIIVDDGSTDATAAYLQQLTDPRIRIVSQSNQGEGAAINNGWAAARGEHVAIVSSDDPMLPFWLEGIVETLQRHAEAVVAYPDWLIIDRFGAGQQVARRPDYDHWEMVAGFSAQPGAGALIRKSAGDRLEFIRWPGYRHAGDLDMWLRLSLLGPFVRVPRVLAQWRLHAGSITVAERSAHRAAEFVTIAEAFLARPDFPPGLAPFRNRCLASAHNFAAWALEETDAKGAKRHRDIAAALAAAV